MHPQHPYLVPTHVHVNLHVLCSVHEKSSQAWPCLVALLDVWKYSFTVSQSQSQILGPRPTEGSAREEDQIQNQGVQ